MSLYNEASLVMVPSAYKDQKVYSVKPFDGSGDLTFTRATTATRVNANGYIEKAQVNLLLQSNSFDTTWISLTTTLTGGQAGYDGTNDAWLLEKTATAGSHIVQSITQSGVQTFSVYVKANTLSKITLWANVVGSGNPFAEFDLSTETLSDSSLLIASNIVSVGSGWYRVEACFNEAITMVRIYVDDFSTTTAGSIYIQDAQLNYGLVAQDYQETTTAAVVSGITDNMPRLNYDPANPTCTSLLLEPSRQNIIAQAEYLASSYWSTLNAQFTANATTSPEGVQNAFKLGGTTGGADQVYVGVSLALPAGGTYTYSFFAKADDKSWVRLRTLGFDAAANTQTWFNLADGTIGNDGSGNAKIENYGNGWYRCSYSLTTTTDLVGSVYAYLAESNGGYAVDRDGSGIFLWGAQLEAGAYATSYIPTYGTSATRTKDYMVTSTLSNDILPTGGFSVMWEADLEQSDIQFDDLFNITGSSAGSRWEARVNNQVRFQGGGYISGDDPNSTIVGTISSKKFGATFSASQIKLYTDGVLIGTFNGSYDTDYETIGNNIQGTSVIEKQILLFPSVLTESEMITLTTL